MRLFRRSLIISLVSFFMCLSASATETNVAVVFNAKTLERGYTVCSNDKELCVPVAPKQFSKKLTVNIKSDIPTALLPADMVAKSQIYLLDIKTIESGMLHKPVRLVFNLADLSEQSEIYFYDSYKGQWRALKSSINNERNRITADIYFPYVQLAVLSPKEKIVDENNLTAESALVIDKMTGAVLFNKNANEVRPIASLTKLLTVLTFLDLNPGWEKTIKMEKSDFVGGASLWVKEGDVLSVKDLFYSTLVGSKNNAAVALARSTGLSVSEFVARMNQKAVNLGLHKTYVVEPTGLDERNVSTAEEVAVVARAVFKNMDVVKASTTKWYEVKPKNNPLSYWVKNTSMKVLERDLYVTGSKTGWTDEAGYCLVTQAKKDNHEILALVMGAAVTKNYEEVYSLLKKNL